MVYIGEKSKSLPKSCIRKCYVWAAVDGRMLGCDARMYNKVCGCGPALPRDKWKMEIEYKSSFIRNQFLEIVHITAPEMYAAIWSIIRVCGFKCALCSWRDYIWRHKLDWRWLPWHFFWIYFSISSLQLLCVMISHWLTVLKHKMPRQILFLKAGLVW